MCETAEVSMGETEVMKETEENDDALQEVERPIGTPEYRVGDLSQQQPALIPHGPTMS